MRRLLFAIFIFVTASFGHLQNLHAQYEPTALQKYCSDQADARDLHGAARAAFRGQCKAGGGPGNKPVAVAPSKPAAAKLAVPAQKTSPAPSVSPAPKAAAAAPPEAALPKANPTTVTSHELQAPEDALHS